jgi:CRP/FNR family cyclic AMP-dependent transcriptional regulator
MGNSQIRTRFLSVLSAKQRLKLTMESPQRGLAKGEFLYLPGDEAEVIYILVSGRIKLSRIQECGRENPLEILETGELFGIEWLQGQTQRQDYAQAMDACRVIAISPERIQALMEEQPELHLILLRILGEKLRDSHSAIERLMLRDVKARLASLLLDLAQRCGIEVEDGVRLATRITHQDMANLIGSTRETTTAMLNQFKRCNLIQVQSREITIAGWDGLQKLAS